MSKLVNQWIDLFRAGDYRDAGKGLFTSDDVQQIVDNYDPAHHEAPAVIGHPKNDAPAYGWFDQLRRVGDLLQGKMRQADPAFEDAVANHRFKKRSVSLYSGAKGYSLRHVGFLGAQPPEIKGLADIAFQQEDKDAIEIEFSEETTVDITEQQQQSMVDKMLAGIKGYFTQQPAIPAAGTKTFGEEEAKALVAAAVSAAVEPLQTKLNEQATTFSEAQTAAQAAASKSRAEAAIAGLKTSGKWVPAFDVMGLPHVFDEVAKITTTVEFGEGDKKTTKTPLQIMVDFFESHDKIVPIGRKVETGPKPGTTRAYAEGTSDNSIKFNDLVEELEKKEKITFQEAARRVAVEHPELTVSAGGTTAGKV